MGCGASSTNTSDSTPHDAMHNHLTAMHIDRSTVRRPDAPSAETIRDARSPQDSTTALDRRNALRNFNHLESAIQTMEETRCFEKYRVVSDDLEQLKKQLQGFTDAANRINSQIFNLVEANKLSGDASLQGLVIDKWMQQGKLNAKDEILDIKAELAQKDIERFDDESREAKTVCDQLQDLYQQRDTILNQIFEGSYGNEKEMHLEKEVDGLMEERHYIEIAKMRWVNSNKIIAEAIRNLENGAEKLHQFENMPKSNLVDQYGCIQEARNSLATYLYKVAAVQGTLLNVKLPHLRQEDLADLEKRTRELLVDTLAASRLKQTLEVAHSLLAKTATQHKWIREVLNSTIKADLHDIRDRCRAKAHELRFERAVLIKQRLDLDSDQSAKTDSPFDLRVDSGVDSELGVDESALTDEQMARMVASGKQSELSSGTPLLPGEELAPIPSDSEIFGKIVQLRNRHTREMAEFEQNQRLIRVRIAQGLRDKLSDRRSRRSRNEMHRRHLEALQESPLSAP